MNLKKVDKLLSRNLPENLEKAGKIIVELKEISTTNKQLDVLENMITDCLVQVRELSDFWNANKLMTTDEFARLTNTIRSIVASNLDLLKQEQAQATAQSEMTDFDRKLDAYRQKFRLDMMLNTKVLGDFLIMLEKLS